MEQSLSQWVSAAPWLIFVFFVLVWCATCWLVAWGSGWRALGGRFSRQNEPCGQTRSAGGWFTRIYLRFWTKYTGAVRMVAAADGLYLSVFFLLRPGHPPLCIPWEQIRIQHTRKWLQNYVELTLGSQERIPLRFSERVARELELDERMVTNGQMGPSGPVQ
jgi:hypothetical protein